MNKITDILHNSELGKKKDEMCVPYTVSQQGSPFLRTVNLVLFISLSFIVIHEIGWPSLETAMKEPETFRLLKQLNSAQWVFHYAKLNRKGYILREYKGKYGG